ncbi:DUF5686 and carboxypeptidase regulatory-like domain-containing protein [Taibaiella chishuiensis]|uniref:Carboxypeptidase-like protein n=1 Tax=Taibaiella chishuiensis TaxID=1434707 RepID=A0A2P8D690_9BACT|nr:DUF5686 and carboxypeptidase regulatory-like domain-containing protein [Taibaiella chishuiensis]PSK92711.1 carboxypeptidase-like protein [Taibaiella chishuiensis]
MKTTLSTLLFLCLFAGGAFALTIKGKITDETGAALPFATVLEKGTANGTSANGDGYYTLELSNGAHTLSCQYIGYKTVTKQVNGDATTTVNFQLNPQTLEVKEVTVKANGEDPAYPIMRKVIERRKYHEQLIRTLESDIYLKGTLRLQSKITSFMGKKLKVNDQDAVNDGLGLDSTGKGIIYLLEQYTQYAFKAPSKEYTRVVSVRQSGDPQGLGFNTMPPIINIYANNIKIMEGLNERGFISPANSNAFLYYRYKFLGSYMEGDRMINKIQVTPKRKFEPLFTGYVYVVDDEWVFQSVELTLGKESQIQNIDTLRLEQYYVPVAKDVWTIHSQVLYPVLNILGINISGNFLTAYKNMKINQPISDDRFAGKIISSYDSSATERSAAYWDTLRPVPLETDEVKDYRVKDSLYTFKKAKQDSLSRIPSRELGVGAFLLSGPTIKVGKNTWSMRPLISSIAYNTVEGLNATLGLRWDHRINEDKVYALELLNRYGFSNSRYNALLKYNYALQDPAWKGRTWRFGLQGGQYVYQLNNNDPITPLINEAYTLFGGQNYMKLYQARLGRFNVSREWGNGLKASLGLAYEQRLPLENTTDYTFSDKQKVNLTPNQPGTLPLFEAHKAAVINASISYQPGWKYTQYPKYKSPQSSDAPVFTARYTKGIPNIFDSKSDFDKWSAEVEHKIRMRLLGRLDYRVMAGGFLNRNYVGIPDMKHLFGNQTFLANPYLNSFQLAPYYKYSNTADFYVQAHAEWHLGGLLTNKIPVFRRLDWYLVGGSNALYINKDNYYAEVFVGLENIGIKMVRFGRVDLIAGYESGKGKPSVGVRIGFGEVLWQLLGVKNTRGE